MESTMDDEVIEVETMTIACDGGGELGHPNVYLHIDEDSHDIVCPYCSRKFVLKEGADVSAGH
ncbi:zinc-finger domain-containing protein [Rhodospirillales bacterium]|jgi:uncharacterized Zn-finger protein|nr:zinc-finger domain-containing protein [Rhodospirillales bacterium]